MTSPHTIASVRPPVQTSLDDLGTPLADVTFCVVDLETTGEGRGLTSSPRGAVKVRGGACLGTFQTLVNPVGPFPPTSPCSPASPTRTWCAPASRRCCHRSRSSLAKRSWLATTCASTAAFDAALTASGRNR
ncbi:MAG: hypothetical protein IPH38_11065 [Candidatus Microthrix sp.]|nr:hypothetical protein [Candidatus Microthrix sp.]MBK7020105.1 hypothetical protein [Candidatus Microthrix sp.]